MSIIEIISTVLGLACVYLAGRGKVLNFWFGYVYCLFLFLLFMKNHLYSSMLLQPVSVLINIIGHYRWTHPKEFEKDEKSELKVSRMTNPTRILNLVVILFFAILWGWIIQQGSYSFPDLFEPATHPYLDAFVTVMILTAQYFSAQKQIECWIAWTVVNVSQIVLYLLSGMILMPIVSLIYLILAYWGYKSWKKSLDKNAYVENK